MPKNFDELLSQDHTFIVRGETFTWREVRPEVLTSLRKLEIDDETDPNLVWEALDEQIMKFLVPEDRERWKRLRQNEDTPITIRQLNAILEYIISEQTERPFEMPSPSVSGRGRTAVSSKAG